MQYTNFAADGVPTYIGQLTNLRKSRLEVTISELATGKCDIVLLTKCAISHNDAGVLDISYTTFYGPLDGSIFKPLQELVYLEMGGNWYNSTFPMEIATLPKLEALYVDDTNLQGDIEFIHTMSAIFEIWLDNNPVLGGTIPTETGLHRDLSSMSLTNCNITGKFLVSFYHNVDNIAIQLGDTHTCGKNLAESHNCHEPIVVFLFFFFIQARFPLSWET
jgi:hypothetical protein